MIMIWEEYRIICRLNIIIFFLVSELIQKQVKKFIIQYFYSPYKCKSGFKSVVLPCGRNLSCYEKAKQFIDDY